MNEKERLEIEELKLKVEDQKGLKIWSNYFQPIIPVVVTLIIAIWGTILTNRYNNAQIEITRKKDSADEAIADTQLRIAETQLKITLKKNLSDSGIAAREFLASIKKNKSDSAVAQTQLKMSDNKDKSDKNIAEINASLSFLKLAEDSNGMNAELMHQAKITALPALPPETGFRVAVNELSYRPSALDVLFKYYKKDSYKYIAQIFEISPPVDSVIHYLSIGLEGKEHIKDAVRYFLLFYQHDAASIAVFNYLKNKGQLTNFLDYIASSHYSFLNRGYTLMNFFVQVDNQIDGNDYKQEELYQHTIAIIEKSRDQQLIFDLAIGPAMEADDRRFLKIAIDKLWKIHDVSKGQTFDDGGIEDIFYNQDDSVAILLDSKLFAELRKINYAELPLYNLQHIYISFLKSKEYLDKDQIREIYTKIMREPKNFLGKQKVNNFFGWIEDTQFKKFLKDSYLSSEIISWYNKNWIRAWGHPGIIKSIVALHPDLKSTIDERLLTIH